MFRLIYKVKTESCHNAIADSSFLTKYICSKD
jgi:hypothetical protein